MEGNLLMFLTYKYATPRMLQNEVFKESENFNFVVKV
jgi:hypothetical protein